MLSEIIHVYINFNRINHRMRSNNDGKGSKETQIKKSFAKTLDMYPTENLEDFYDKEGYRDGEFKKATKVLGLLDLK